MLSFLRAHFLFAVVIIFITACGPSQEDSSQPSSNNGEINNTQGNQEQFNDQNTQTNTTSNSNDSANTSTNNTTSSDSGTDTSTTYTSSNFFYIDATLGNDDNDGRSENTAWKSFINLQQDLGTAPTILLKRGEQWEESLEIKRGDISISAYGDVALARPLLDGTSVVPSWTLEQGNIYRYQPTVVASDALGNLSINDSMVLFQPWLGDVATTFSGITTNAFSFDNSAQILYLYSQTTPQDNTYRYSHKLVGIAVHNQQNIAIENITVQGYSFHGVQLENCQNCSVTNSTIKNIGGVALGPDPDNIVSYLYAGNGIEFGNSASNGLIDSVTISDIFDSCLSPQTYDSFQVATNFVFRNSNLSRCGFAGVEISLLSNGGSNNSQLSNITLSNLVIRDIGKGWSGRRYGSEGHGIRIKADSGAGLMSNVRIENNDIQGAAGDGIRIAGSVGNVALHQLRIAHNDGYGIQSADAVVSNIGFTLSSSLVHHNGIYGVLANTPNASGYQVLHNTFFQNGQINLALFTGSGTNRILNNLFANSSNLTHLFSLGTLSNAEVNYNCYQQTDSGQNIIGYDSAAYTSLSGFLVDTGFGTNSLTTTDPAFVDVANEDFLIASNSDCASPGSSSTGVTVDFAGNTYSFAPARGALQP